MSFALWLLGYPDQALKRVQEALTLAQGLSHPFSLAFALTSGSFLRQFRREVQAAMDWTEAVMALANEQGFQLWLAWGTILREWELSEQGQGDEGIEQMRQGLVTSRAMEIELNRPYFLTLLAEVCGKVGQTEEGLNMLAEALDTANKTEERWYEAELYHLKGDLILQSRVQSLESIV
ncbi:MAG: hypothetical protein O6837_03010 [Deltaproteobacteria bacterium]|nr:hypothetical protein [Deltaproteobacteria bacterium]